MRIFALLAALALCVAAAPTRAAPANTLQELTDQLGGCLSREGGWQGGELTLRFSLRRDGSIIGKPHISFSRLPKDEIEKRRILENIAVAMDRCLPLQITDALGGAIAGRMMAFRFMSKGREIGI